MKIIIKTLKQATFEIDVPSEKSTIAEVKKLIESSKNYEAEQLKLLHSGVVLEDEKTLEDYKIEEGASIIMMISKVKVKKTETQPQAQNPNPEEPKQDEKKEDKKEENKPEQKPQEAPENKYASSIQTLLDMGFEKSQAEAAIKAARGQISLAIDYLYSGIPEGIDDNDQLEGEDIPQGEGEGEEGEENVDPLKKTASVAKLICQSDPSKLTNLLQNIQQSDPELFNLIHQREEEFKNLLEQPVNQEDFRNFRIFQREMGLGEGEQGGHEGHGGHRGIQLNLTEEDKQAIKRLKDLGNFNEADVIQAYIACEKNEEMAANYLFEQKMMDDDEMFKNNNNNNNNNQ